MPRGLSGPLCSVLLAVALCVTGCTATVSGHPEPASSRPASAPPSTPLPSYQPFPDGSGFSTEPMDQPYPLPDQFWPGQRDVCEWVTPDLAEQVGGTGETGVSASGCNILMGGNELVQTGIIGPYGWVTDSTRSADPSPSPAWRHANARSPARARVSALSK